MYSFTVAITNASYMFQLQRGHQAVYVGSIKGNHVPVVYIYIGHEEEQKNRVVFGFKPFQAQST
jgi:hypothetical protein